MKYQKKQFKLLAPDLIFSISTQSMNGVQMPSHNVVSDEAYIMYNVGHINPDDYLTSPTYIEKYNMRGVMTIGAFGHIHTNVTTTGGDEDGMGGINPVIFNGKEEVFIPEKVIQIMDVNSSNPTLIVTVQRFTFTRPTIVQKLTVKKKHDGDALQGWVFGCNGNEADNYLAHVFGKENQLITDLEFYSDSDLVNSDMVYPPGVYYFMDAKNRMEEAAQFLPLDATRLHVHYF